MTSGLRFHKRQSGYILADMDDVYAINIARTEMREGYNTGDIDRIMSAFASGFTDWSDAMPCFYGRQAAEVLRARLAKLFRDYEVSLELVIIAVWVYGNIAIDTGWKNFKFKSNSTKEAKEESRRYFALWERNSDQRWQIVRYIDNLDVPPRLATDVLAELCSAYVPLS
jgi:ketosteroid isomerase-like protein